MTKKESEDSTTDYGFISKYIKDGTEPNNKNNGRKFSSNMFKSECRGSVEVFGKIGEGGGNTEDSNGHYKHEDDENFDESKVTIESKSPITDTKREFIKQMEDDSLSIDTCTKLNHDWKKK